ncbi:DUF3592 domain-containing protein [Amycolatopsis sp. cmx-8-4]|uniref:DUF3592 domain-containing protein n=1 Tax=Amycolatopsis sp. cmx-8-4 TaxID=2790947 RepID=UPI00397B2390
MGRRGARAPGRWRTAWLIVAAYGAAAFVTFGTGTVWSFLVSRYEFENGELAADFAVLGGSLAAIVVAVFLARRPDRRGAAVLAGPPKAAGRPRVGTTANPRPRKQVRLAWGFAAVLYGVLAAGVLGLSALDLGQADLLATGARTGGVVLDVRDPARGTPTIEVRYTVAGESRVAKITWDSGRPYFTGEGVTVVYDPADPAHVRTPEEKNDDRFLVGLYVVLLLITLVLLPFPVVVATHAGREGGTRFLRGYRPGDRPLSPER